MADLEAQDAKVEVSNDTPPMQYPQLATGNNPLPQNPQAQLCPPTQQYQPPPSYGVHQYPPHTKPQSLLLVVRKQPQSQGVVTSHSSSGEVMATFSLVFSIIWNVLSIICCALPLLGCTIPALTFSIISKDRYRKGEVASARTYSRLACGLNIFALFGFIIFVTLVVIFGPIKISIG